MADQQKTENILVIKLSALGDFIQAMGPMAAIRRHHDNARITLLTTASFEKFAKECGYFDDIIVDDRPKWYQFGQVYTLKKQMLSGQFSRVYDLQNNDRTGFYFSLFPQNKKPEWVGIAKGASHRNTSPERTAGHAFDGHVQTLALAGINDVTVDRLEWMKADLSGFSLKDPYIVFVPGCAPEHPQKRWPAEKYGRLAVMLTQMGYQVILLGTKAEKDATDAIQSICPQALDLNSETSLYQIVELGRHAAAAIGNDTGPMHMIGATGCPSIVLFSSHSDPVRHAPKGECVDVIQVADLSDLKSEDVLNKIRARFAEQTNENMTAH